MIGVSSFSNGGPSSFKIFSVNDGILQSNVVPSSLTMRKLPLKMRKIIVKNQFTQKKFVKSKYSQKQSIFTTYVLPGFADWHGLNIDKSFQVSLMAQLHVYLWLLLVHRHQNWKQYENASQPIELFLNQYFQYGCCTSTAITKKKKVLVILNKISKLFISKFTQ